MMVRGEKICVWASDFHTGTLPNVWNNVRGVSNEAVFNRKSIRLSNDDTRKVHILLTSCVRRIETNDKGIALVFKKKEDADTWKSIRKSGRGTRNNQPSSMSPTNGRM